MDKWKPVIQLALALGIGVFALFYALSNLEGILVKKSGKDSKLASDPSDFLRKKKRKVPVYVQLVTEADNLPLERDPFLQEVSEVPVEQPLTLQGILWEEDASPKAMINDEIVEIGSSIDQFTVVDIKADHVIMIENDLNLPPAERMHTLRLSEP